MIGSSEIYYISTSYREDENHVQHATETRRKAYALVESVTSSEWFNGGRNGLNPALRFTVFFFDWYGEKIVEYEGVRYSVYRTFRPDSNSMELYAELRKGPENEN